jgi:hypothetical protein
MTAPNLAVRSIRLRGFRGMLAPFEVPLSGKTASGIVHGRNGSGKSSITDAWEFLHVGRIGHLAKEGAGPESYAHRKALADESYVEIEFVDAAMGVVRWYTDGRTSSKDAKAAKKKLELLRAHAPHPCQIRFADLSRFVELTKTERHDALAGLMGFTAQVETQKALRRVHKSLKEQAEASQARVNVIAREISALLGEAECDDVRILELLNGVFSTHGAPLASSRETLGPCVESLAAILARDSAAVELSSTEAFHRVLTRLVVTPAIRAGVENYVAHLRELRAHQATAVDALLMTLYDAGAATLRESEYREDDPCPLCGQPFVGDLRSHIEIEVDSLRSLKQHRDQADVQRRKVISALSAATSLHGALTTGIADSTAGGVEWSAESLLACCGDIEAAFDRVRELLQRAPEQVDDLQIASLATLVDELATLEGLFLSQHGMLVGDATQRIQALRADTSRAALVADHAKASRVVERWTALVDARNADVAFVETTRRFGVLVEDFVTSSILNVQARFKLISDEVEQYFNILEAHTAGIQNPALRLLHDQDRAVVLEVEFRGDVISPAYKYLSESQLNSFGLAVFLASARRFNPNFRFLVLDDVVNSFDGQKRPQVIKLLKQEFAEHQILLLTHDRVWWARLTDAFRSWTRLHIVRYEPLTGPVVAQGRSEIEEIERLLAADDPRGAGGLLGPFLEKELQDLCEGFEVLVTYNRRNEYTLAPLLERFRVRVSSKLGAGHLVTTATVALESDLMFRNFMAHWKDPDSEITVEELSTVLERWKDLDALLSCAEPKCHGVPEYDGDSAFACACGTLVLSK